MTGLVKIAEIINTVTRWGGRLATVILLAMIALVFYNVVGRYMVGGSSVWMQELEWHLLAPSMLIGISVLMLEKGHVRVDMVYNRLSVKTQQLLDFISMLVGVMIAVLFIRYSFGFVDASWSVLEGSPDPGGLPGRYILKALLPVCFGLLALQCLANAIMHLADLLDHDTRSTPTDIA